MARILVTGGAGFIGAHLVARLVARGDEVVVLDDLSLGRADKLAPFGDRVTLVHGRVQDALHHRDAMAGVERIVHLAALISGYDSLTDADAYLDANVTGTLRVMELSRALGGARILFASSSTVYGNRPDPVRRETDLPAPMTVYAASKLLGEHLLAMYAPLYGFRYTALRLFNVYGPGQNPHHPYANVTCKFARAAARGEAVPLYGDGDQTRDFVYIDDVIAAFLAVEHDSAAPVYNVGTGSDAPIRALIDHASAAAGQPLRVEHRPPWPNDIRKIQSDCDLLRGETGWAPQVSLADGIARTVAWFRDNP